MAEKKSPHGLAKNLRAIYMYLVSLVCVVVFIIGAVNLLNTALKTWVFPTNEYEMSYYSEYDDLEMTPEEQEIQRKEVNVSRRNQDLAFGVSMTVVSLPIWLLHMWFLKRDKKKNGK